MSSFIFQTCYSIGKVRVAVFAMIALAPFSMITLPPSRPQVGLFSMNKWARFRLTKTSRRRSP
jgi:hypothetical protein